MVFTNMEPWMLLLWIVCLCILVAPILVATVNSIFNGYFKAREGHIGRVAKALGKTIEKTADEMTKRLKTGKSKEEKKDESV